MPVVNPLARELVFKIVYYGPGLGGKTSSLQHIHATSRPEHRGKMVSLATPVDRTLYFDFLPLRLPAVRGLGVRLQLFTVPGQVYYNATRKLVLTGADGVVLVLDSQRERLDAGLESLQNLRDNLREHGRSLGEVPWVVQYNKRDLPDAAPLDELEARVNPEGVPSFGTVATDGTGIYEALEAITRLVMDDFRQRIPTTRGAAPPELSLPEGGLAAVLRAADLSELEPVSLPVVATPALVPLATPGEVEASAAAVTLQQPPSEPGPSTDDDAGLPGGGAAEPSPLHILELQEDTTPALPAPMAGGAAGYPPGLVPGPDTPRPRRMSSRPPVPALAPAPLPEAEPLPSLSDPAFSLSFAQGEPEPGSGEPSAAGGSPPHAAVTATVAGPAEERTSPRLPASEADPGPQAASSPDAGSGEHRRRSEAPAGPGAPAPAVAVPELAPGGAAVEVAAPPGGGGAGPSASGPDAVPPTPRNLAPEPYTPGVARTVVPDERAPLSPAPDVAGAATAEPAAPRPDVDAISEGGTRESAVEADLPAVEGEPEPMARGPSDRPGPRTRRSFRPTELGGVAGASGLSFEALWPELERPTVAAAEAALASGDAAQAMPLLDQLLSRTLAGAAGAGAADAPRDPAIVVLLLGVDGRRWLRFRGLVREARAGKPVTLVEALQAFAFVLEVRAARARMLAEG